jgi:hypothetical protein
LARLSNGAASVAANAVTALLNGGTLAIFDGPRPATADVTPTDQRLLAKLTFGEPAYIPAVHGVATANEIAPDIFAEATGTATWFRAFTRGGAAVFDGSIGADLNLDNVEITEGALVFINGLTYTQGKS